MTTPRGLAGALLLVGQAVLIVLILAALFLVIPGQELCPDPASAACAAAKPAP